MKWRKCEVFDVDEEKWIARPMLDIKKDDMYRLFESNGERVKSGTGINIWIAIEDAESIKPEGNCVVKCAVVHDDK